MERLFVDALGVSLGIAVAFIFYSMLWSRKKINPIKGLCCTLIILVGYAVAENSKLQVGQLGVTRR